MTKNGLYHFYPSAKSRRELKIKTSGVISRGASAYCVQNTIAPPKQAVCRFSDEKISDEHFCRFFLPNIFVRCRKMKCRGSSETRFPKVWGRTELSSEGKRPFKVFQKLYDFWCFRRRKMKWRGSSETRFPNVWGRTEPCLRGKRSFEVRAVAVAIDIKTPTRC